MKKKIILVVGILFLLAGLKGIVQWVSFDASSELAKFDSQVMVGINDLDKSTKNKIIQQREKVELNILGHENNLILTGIIGLLVGGNLIAWGLKS